MDTDSSAPTTPRLQGEDVDQVEAPESPATSIPSRTRSGSTPSPSKQEQQQKDKAASPPPGKQGNYIAIPPIAPIASHEPPAKLARGLEGRFVDEFGNVLGWDGTVLGRVQGDLPAMVGRPVAAGGQVLDVEGQVAGYVCESFVGASHSSPSSHSSSSQQQQRSGGGGATRELDRGLRVDDAGTIYNQEGVAVGRMTTTTPAPAPAPAGAAGAGAAGQGSAPPPPPHQRAGGHAPPQPPSSATPSPSEVFLDVKSTHDGIQLIIKIPTVFHSGCGNSKVAS